MRLSDRIRLVILKIYTLGGWDSQLIRRTMFTEVGFSGHVSLPDSQVAKDENLKPLNRFELWLLAPMIAFEREIRKSALREACIEVLGEDPQEWGKPEYYT